MLIFVQIIEIIDFSRYIWYSLDIQNGKHCADHGRDFRPLADHMTMLRNFTKREIRVFSVSMFNSLNV